MRGRAWLPRQTSRGHRADSYAHTRIISYRDRSGVETYAIVDGSLEPRSGSVGSGRSEICWAAVTPDDRFAFTTNFADGAVSRYAIGADGSLSLDDATAGIAVDGMTGLRADDGRIYGWSVGAAGALEPVGSWEGLPATVAGLAAS